MPHEPLKVRVVFALVMAGLMVTLITFVLGPLRTGFQPGWLGLWGNLWFSAFPVAALAVGFVAPLARRLTLRLLAIAPQPGAGQR